MAAAGTPVALASSGVYEWLYLVAHDANTGVCHVGASSVVSAIAETARGIPVPEQLGTAAAVVAPLRIDGPGSMADIFVDAVTNGDSVSWFGLLQG